MNNGNTGLTSFENLPMQGSSKGTDFEEIVAGVNESAMSISEMANSIGSSLDSAANIANMYK